MYSKYSICNNCKANNLVDAKRIAQINLWEYARDNYVKRIEKVQLILLGELMPANRYFYDISIPYKDGGLRNTLKNEFNKQNQSDSHFLDYLVQEGIILFDCALCPLHKLKKNSMRRKAATHCFLTINMHHLLEYPAIPIVTIFPNNCGYLKREIPEEISKRVIAGFSFSNQTGLNNLVKEL